MGMERVRNNSQRRALLARLLSKAWGALGWGTRSDEHMDRCGFEDRRVWL